MPSLEITLKFNQEYNRLECGFPLTNTQSRIRIKEQNQPNGYGSPIAPRQTIISQKHYIEWQIKYDNELSEFLLRAFEYSFISRTEIISLKSFIEKNNDFVENTIQRTNFVPENFAGFDFLTSTVNYPLRHYCLGNNMWCEIAVCEKQHAMGIMPMLYFCLPMSTIYDKNCLCLPMSAIYGKSCQIFVGRKIDQNEKGYLFIDKNNINIFMQMFSILGVLSPSHKHYCLQILNYILSR